MHYIEDYYAGAVGSETTTPTRSYNYTSRRSENKSRSPNRYDQGSPDRDPLYKEVLRNNPFKQWLT